MSLNSYKCVLGPHLWSIKKRNDHWLLEQVHVLWCFWDLVQQIGLDGKKPTDFILFHISGNWIWKKSSIVWINAASVACEYTIRSLEQNISVFGVRMLFCNYDHICGHSDSNFNPIRSFKSTEVYFYGWLDSYLHLLVHVFSWN